VATERRLAAFRYTALACALLMLAVTMLSAFVRLTGADTDAVLLARGAHRVAASTVLVAVIALLAISLGPKPYLQREGRHALALLALAVFLAVLGRWSSGTPPPPVVLGNLLGGFLMLALCGRLVLPARPELSERFRYYAWLAVGILLLQVVLGALRHPAHPLTAVALLVLLAPFATALWYEGERAIGIAILALLGTQLAIGVLQYASGQPVGLVLAHNTIAVLLLTALLYRVQVPGLDNHSAAGALSRPSQ
jgi:heme a synthase